MPHIDTHRKDTTMATLFRQQLVELVAIHLGGHGRVRLGGWRVMGHVPEAHRMPLVNLAERHGIRLRSSDFVGWHRLKDVRASAAAAAALLALLLVRPAAAETIGEVPGDRSTPAVVKAGGQRWHTSRFERPDDRDWFRVRLEARGHYALGVTAWESESLEFAVRDQAGRVLAGDQAWFVPEGDGDTIVTGGVEFVAPYAGWYYVSLHALEGTGGYAFTVRHDCDAGPTSRCRLEPAPDTGAYVIPGATAGDGFQWGQDRDWYAVPLVAGTGYALTSKNGLANAARLVAPDGAVTELDRLPTGLGERLRFTVPVTGRWWLELYQHDSWDGRPADFNTSYTVTLTTDPAP
jgi:hypothetical protein